MATAHPSRAPGRLELALSISGVALSGFMVLHLGLLFSVLLGTQSMDALASFLERYYLLQAGAPLLMVLLFGHILVAARKVPTAFQPQSTLLRHMRSLRHLDTWAWAAQALTGVAMLVLVSIHLWVILTDLPIQALKSGARVYGIYLWFYIPFVVLVEAHISLGLYRLATKWGLLSRPWAHGILTAWTAVALGLGGAILFALYRVGGSQ
ncbi:MAG: succinate dehydrogenase/fumarate reductase cytochrome b subunit [Chloroflexi bacterium]|nr:succinate dehydrogenase/fumarate reductase cytochrome b subunit [Chloroflexota bacterium]